jgi:hypothetical protein
MPTIGRGRAGANVMFLFNLAPLERRAVSHRSGANTNVCSILVRRTILERIANFRCGFWFGQPATHWLKRLLLQHFSHGGGLA